MTGGGDLEVRLKATAGGNGVGLDIDVDLRAPPGGLVLVGPNGAGKTTALLMTLGFRSPREGRVAAGGRVLFDSSAGVDLPPEHRALGYVPQTLGLFPHLSARDNVVFGMSRVVPRLSNKERTSRAQEILDAMGAGALADRRPNTLSGGERQRVALARALASDPKALLLDEPLSSLDATAREEMRRFLSDRLATWKIPAVIVTHDRRDAECLGGTIAVMEAGRIAQLGSLEDLARAPATEFVRRFVSSG